MWPNVCIIGKIELFEEIVRFLHPGTLIGIGNQNAGRSCSLHDMIQDNIKLKNTFAHAISLQCQESSKDNTSKRILPIVFVLI